MSLEGLNRRIKTTSDLGEIVSTMKMLSSVSVTQYERALKALTQYAYTIQDAFHGLFTQDFFHYTPPKIPKTNTKILAIIIGSDNGLVGRFNRDLMAYVQRYIHKNYPDSTLQVMAVGKRIGLLANIQKLHIQGTNPISNSLKEIAPMAAQFLNQINDIVSHHKIDTVYIFFNRKQDTSAFVPQARQIIPLPDDQLQKLQKNKWNGRTLPLITADKHELFSALIREYLILILSHTLVSSLVSEHYTRMIHMQEAENNIKESLEEFNLQYQQLRQTQITDELIDIVSGAEEMNKQKNQTPLDFTKKNVKMSSIKSSNTCLGTKTAQNRRAQRKVGKVTSTYRKGHVA